MSDVSLEFHGIHQVGPEDDVCAVLRWPEENRLIPVWISPIEGMQLAAVLDGHQPNRPTSHDLICEVLEGTGGVEAIEIANYHQGTFMVDIKAPNGEVYDSRLSDALAVSAYFNVPISAEADLLAQVSVYASDADVKEYFDLEISTPGTGDDVQTRENNDSSTSASGNAQADADFEAMMRSLGMEEKDFLSGDDDEKS
ncbi:MULTISPECIES: bifunctional nuclease family protein [Corynebacterium]|uniref:bifunctional nuclease family protein n=1 Tax=Corynebacterium TaxID=1716 RepID=UPI001EF3D147|nr:MULTISPECIES: bifunctional nuclease family protein [Corynebacterium]MCG7465012.1 bifunctional nuclease family protein [Corynebacterium sp. ACRPJ]MDK8677157.1 bifunctional nuclease family protein [Corynebacterium tuberculostearicum]WKE53893.1 bifunctional nuclease family protein [Corynebacterium tuberculostearicum]